jgi:geranylgeranyl pyrophosphate synthase
MAEIMCKLAVGSSDIETSLAAVEICMHDALSPEAFSLTQAHRSAHSAASYHLDAGGRRVRARLALAAGFALGLSKADTVYIASCAELLHNASLVHDDIQDRDMIRRGQAAVWSKYGNNLAICTGDLLLSAAYGVLCRFSQPLLLPEMLGLLHKRIAVAIQGQCADLATSGGQSEDLQTYLRIATAKSGALLSLPLELALVATDHANAATMARRACESLAVSYQILDDLQDLEVDSACATSCVDQTQSLNIVFVLLDLNDRSSLASQAQAIASARALAHDYLTLCEEQALQLPRGSGELILALTAELRALLNVQTRQ